MVREIVHGILRNQNLGDRVKGGRVSSLALLEKNSRHRDKRLLIQFCLPY